VSVCMRVRLITNITLF